MKCDYVRKICLVVFCLYSSFFFAGSTLAPIAAHFGFYELSAKLTASYMYSCHQQPDRSFWLLGYPVALCCRCYGFYIGVIISGIIALFNKLNIKLKTFLILTVLCIIDIVINYGLNEKHNTGSIVRFVIGAVMGVLFVRLLDALLKYKRRVKNEN